MTTDNERDLQALVQDFMRQEQCPEGFALHIVTRVAKFIGASEVDTLLGVLRTIEAETVAEPGPFAGEGLRRAKVLRTSSTASS